MGMLEPGGKLYFALEALGTERGCELGVKHFEGYRTVVPQVVGQEDRGHPTPPKLAFESIAVGYAMLEPLVKVCHSGPVVTMGSISKEAYRPAS
jgi:hypothetical protein